MMMFRYFVYPVFLLNEIFFSFFFLFLSFDDYLDVLIRHKQVYVAFLVGNKVYNR